MRLIKVYLKLKMVIKSNLNSFIGICKNENVFSSVQFLGK